MRIFTEQALKEYAENHPDSRVALQEWTTIVKRSKWTCFADIKKTFNSVDNVGNQRYVFNIKGNNYRLVVVIPRSLPCFLAISSLGCTWIERSRLASINLMSSGNSLPKRL